MRAVIMMMMTMMTMMMMIPPIPILPIDLSKLLQYPSVEKAQLITWENERKGYKTATIS